MLFALALLAICFFFSSLLGIFALAAVQAGAIMYAVCAGALALMMLFSMLSVAWTAIKYR